MQSLADLQALNGVNEAFTRGIDAYHNGDHAAAAGHFEKVLAADPGHERASVNLGILRCEAGAFEEGLDRLMRHVRRHPEDEPTGKSLWTAANNAVLHFRARGELAKSLATCRMLAELQPHNKMVKTVLQNYLHECRERAHLIDFTPDVAPEDLGRTLLIACMPKSGSTWLHNVLLDLTGFENGLLSYAFMENEQELYLPRVVDSARQDLVVQQHCRATAPNIAIMQAFAFTPVVLVRNLFDTLLSMRDFYAAGAAINSFLHCHYDRLDADAQLDAVIDLLAPWYIQFFASWDIAERKGWVPIQRMSYETMMADKPAAIAAICDHAGIARTDAEIAAAIARIDAAKETTRFNRGVSGRGEKALTDARKERIRALTRHFPDTDFSPIGL